MVHQFMSNFPHRMNEDGTYDAICVACHMTVATERIEAALSHHERNHKCGSIRIFEVNPPSPTYSLSTNHSTRQFTSL